MSRSLRGHPQNTQRGPNSSSQSAQKNKGVLLSPSRPQTTPKSPAIPVNLSFIAKVEEIRPNGANANRSLDHPQGFFVPPDRRNGYNTKPGHIFLRFAYQNNVFQAVDAVNIQAFEIYRSATVFSQATKTDHLLMVPFDARIKDVSSQDYDWEGIGFEHIVRNSTSTYASLAFLGPEDNLPAPVPSNWEQLIPQPYRFRNVDGEGDSIPSTTNFGGLIGNLPLLIALAAFSAAPNALGATLKNNIRGGRWQPHTHNPGRVPERGLVVTVYLDPTNPTGSTRSKLDTLQNGGYGPFLDI